MEDIYLFNLLFKLNYLIYFLAENDQRIKMSHSVGLILYKNTTNNNHCSELAAQFSLYFLKSQV